MFTGDEVDYTEVKKYQDEYYYSCARIFNRYKQFGLPFAGGWYDSGGLHHSGGWGDHPEYIIRIIEVFAAVIAKFEEHQNDS